MTLHFKEFYEELSSHVSLDLDQIILITTLHEDANVFLHLECDWLCISLNCGITWHSCGNGL
jgi:hypothetical protein